MYTKSVRDHATALLRAGNSPSVVSAATGVSRATLREWCQRPVEVTTSRRCFVCADAPAPQPHAYLYLLGQYLGDGYLSTGARVPRLRIACADAYPGIAAEVDAALESISGNRVQRVRGTGCSDHSAYWMHWPCLFPHSGVGPKHQRPIVLTGWQHNLVRAQPWPLIRGLIHSDGCRSLNRIRRGDRAYEYPRYFFSNESRDIMGLFTDALDLVEVAWRMCRPNMVSVARRASVARLDAHVGPKC